MPDFDRLISRFRQFGGMRLVWQYARMGVLWTGLKEIVRCAVKGRSFKAVYPVITDRIDKILLAKYSTAVTSEHLSQLSQISDGDMSTNNIWFCWLQGIDNAPGLVKACMKSQKQMFGDRVVVLDDKNYTDWITLPDYIVQKYRKGLIPGALFSDILRLELLLKYGGTWIDSTVLASPATSTNASQQQTILKKIETSDLFIYRYIRDGRVVGMSNWFIHARANNPLLRDVRDMLLAYWRDYNCTVDYYIFHLFFGEASKRYPELIQRMPRGNSFHAIMLRDRMPLDFNEKWWNELITHVPFHKLNYRLETKAKANANSYLNHILQYYAKKMEI